MFSATPAKKPHARASASVRRSQSRAASVAASAAGSPQPEGSTSRGGPGAAERRRTIASGNGQHAGYSGSVLQEETPQDVAEMETMGILLKTETHAVSLYGGSLPQEVTALLSHGNFYTDPYAAELDHASGYACLIGRERCYVWSLSRNAHSGQSPTCYTFPVPQATGVSLAATIFSPVPFVAFVNQGSSREPGFLLASTTGQLQYWPSILSALSNVEKFSSASLPLSQGEVVRSLLRIGPTYYVLATSGNRLFKLQLSSSVSSSSVQLQVSLLSRSRGMLARVGGLFGSASADPRAGILALTSALDTSATIGQKSETAASTVLYAVTESVVQQWRISESTGEQYLSEWDVSEGISRKISEMLRTEGSGIDSVQHEILDAKARSPTCLVLLVSYENEASSSTSLTHRSSTRRIEHSYALVTVESEEVTTIKRLAYKQPSDPRPLSTPKLLIPRDGPATFVVFPDVVLVATTQPDVAFEEAVSLRDPARDRLVGAGIQSSSTLTLLAATSGLLQLEANLQLLSSQVTYTHRVDEETQATRSLKNKLDQAIIFGERQQNPLAFDLKMEAEGDLVTAAEQVSKEILASSSPYLPNIIDLRAQIADRAARMRFLITFIQDNSLISKLSKTSKHHLSWDAEKLASAEALWHMQNLRMSAVEGEEEDSLLAEAITSLPGTRVARGEEGTRGFFRYQVDKIGAALEHMHFVLKRRIQNESSDLNTRTSYIYQADQALSLLYKAVIRHRQASANLYGIKPDDTCLAEPWTSRPKMLELLRLVLEQTETLVTDRSRELGSGIDDNQQNDNQSSGPRGSRRLATNEEAKQLQGELKGYMAELADFALAMHQERMAYLQSKGDEGGAVQELRNLLDVYVGLRAQVIQSLVKMSRSHISYDLAERYRDFKSLVLLCNDAKVGSPARITFFMDKYKQDFAFALYQFYLDNNRPYDLLAQEDKYSKLLSEYWETVVDEPRLKWIQDLSTQHYQDASESLYREAQVEAKLAEKKLMLSIGKLAQIACLTKDELATSESAQQALEHIDDRLDLVAAHDRLSSQARSTFEARDAFRPVVEQAKAVAPKLCPDRTGPTRQLAICLFERLLAGDALSTEDLVDLLSLKSNDSDDQKADFAEAIEILSRDEETPHTRKQLALEAAWRRVYLRDHWHELRQLASRTSDETLATSLRTTALYHTLASLASREVDPSLLLRPSASTFNASAEAIESIRARFSGSAYSSVSAEGLISDFGKEDKSLSEAIEGAPKLEEFYDEVERLVHLDAEVSEQMDITLGDDTLPIDGDDSMMA